MRETVRLFYPNAELTFVTGATVCIEKRNIKSRSFHSYFFGFRFHRFYRQFVISYNLKISHCFFVSEKIQCTC